MVKKELLFALIRSLTKAEKRYFKLYCRREESVSNYLKLFNAIDAQEVYDEQVIRKKFKKEAFSKQLHVTKNYLRQLILKCLRNYHAALSKDAELKDVLRNIEILYHRELYPICAEEIKKAEKIAREFELFSGVAEVNGWKRKLEQALYPHNYNRFIELLQEQEKAIDAMYNTNLFWQHAVTTSHNAISNTGNGRERFKKKKTLTPEQAVTLEAKVLFYNTLYITSLRNGMHDQAEQALTDLLSLLEQQPARLKEDPAIYISSANNLVSYYVFVKQYEKAIALIDRSRSLYASAMQQHEKKSLLKLIFRIYNIELEIYRDRKVLLKDPAFIKNIETNIELQATKIPADYLFSFWFQLASIYFRQKDFDQSLKWVNRILNNRNQRVRIDLQIHARMLNLMIHVEQDNPFVLSYFVDSTRRFIKKVKPIQSYELLLLSFFSKIGRTHRFEVKDRFKEIHQQLFSVSAEVPVEALDYIDLKTWIEEKVT